MNDNADNDPRLYAIPDIHGHAKGEHKAFTDERPIPLSARMLFLWFYHACRRGWPRFLMVTDHMNYLTFEDPAAINLVRRALKLAQAGDLYGAAETASVEVGHAAVVSEGLRRGMRYSIGAEVDNDPRSRPDAQNIVDAMKPDGMIRSVHFLTIDHPTHGPNWNWPFDNPEFSDVYETVGTAKAWEIYMATLLDAVERLPGNIVGHFYVPAVFGHWPDDETLESYEDQLVDACEARGMAIEFNTRFLYRDHSDEEKARYLAAHRRLLAKCKAKNVGIAVGSDAHSPKDQGRAFETILALLDECEINELVFPIAGRLARVALRIERKAEAVPAVESTPEVAALDRKATVRKARTSEAPARSKDSSSKRDEKSGGDEVDTPADVTPTNAKPRSKRGKNRAAAAADEVDVAHNGEAGEATLRTGSDAEATAHADLPEVSEPDAPELDAASAEVDVSDSTSDTSKSKPVVHLDEVVEAGESEAATPELNVVEHDTAEPALAHSNRSEEHPAEGVASVPPVVETTTDVVTDTMTELVTEPELPSIVSTLDESSNDELDEESGPADDREGEPINVPLEDNADDDDVTIDAVTIGTAASSAAVADSKATGKLVDATVVEGETSHKPSSVASANVRKQQRTAKVKAASSKAKLPVPKAKPAAKKAARPAVKATVKKAAAKKAGSKKAAVKTATAKKATVKKAPAKKTVLRPAAKKAATKKPAAKKTSAKKPAQKRR